MICIGFGTNDKLHSRLIRWATESEWTHTWIEYPSGVWGGRWAAHSGPDGVVKVPVKTIEKVYPRRVVYECFLDTDALWPGFAWAHKHIGASYDYGVIWNAVLLVIHRATRWAWLYKVVSRNAVRFTCSEFASGFLKASGVKGAEKFDPELTHSGDLERFCSVSEDFQLRFTG